MRKRMLVLIVAIVAMLASAAVAFGSAGQPYNGVYLCYSAQNAPHLFVSSWESQYALMNGGGYRNAFAVAGKQAGGDNIVGSNGVTYHLTCAYGSYSGQEALLGGQILTVDWNTAGILSVNPGWYEIVTMP